MGATVRDTAEDLSDLVQIQAVRICEKHATLQRAAPAHVRVSKRARCTRGCTYLVLVACSGGIHAYTCRGGGWRWPRCPISQLNHCIFGRVEKQAPGVAATVLTPLPLRGAWCSVSLFEGTAAV